MTVIEGQAAKRGGDEGSLGYAINKLRHANPITDT